MAIAQELLDAVGGFVIIEESLDSSIDEEMRREPFEISADVLKKYRDLDRKSGKPLLHESKFRSHKLC